MKYDFDTVIDRTNTNSEKFDFAAEYGKPSDVIPMWVADMDFQTAPEIIHAVTKVAQFGIYGYSEHKQPYLDAIEKWFQKNHHFQIDKKWVVKTPGVVFAICAAIQAFTKENDAILIQRPVYYPFTNSIINNNRVLINNPLVLKNGRYEIDFKDFETKIKHNHVKLFILSNPHNPVGRIWTKEELTRMADICLENRVLILSDEIHCDFYYPGYSHTPLLNCNTKYQENTIVCTSPSKTFNLAGLQVSNILIPNEKLKHSFIKQLHKTGFEEINIMGLAACQTAYEKGEPWLNSLRQYLVGNLDFTRNYITNYIPKISLIEPEGTYLLWLDFRRFGLSTQQLEDRITQKAHLWLDGGTMFGKEGEGFQRINIACPRETLERALLQLKQAFDE